MIHGAEIRYRDGIPAKGMFIVGVDVAPGRYVCRTPGDGRWIRYPRQARPVAGRPGGPGDAEVVIDPGDQAFQSHMPGDWQRVEPAEPAPADPEAPAVAPVFDPELDGDVIERLSTDPGPLRCVRLGGVWPRRGTGPRPLPVVALLMLVGLLLAWLGAAEPSVPGLLLLVTASIAGYGVCRAVWAGRNRRTLRTARAHADRFVIEEDLDARGRSLLARAQAAIREVTGSEVARAGLLEPIDNEVVLPRQEWRIASRLRRVARLRAEQARIAAPGLTPQVEEALRPLRAALDEVTESVESAVAALERYAGRTRQADAAYRAHAQLALLLARAPEYQELLAETAGDRHADGELGRLADNADALERALRESLDAACRAGAELPAADPGPR